MNVFLTPYKRPFFGGTYFPPTPRYGMASWPQILASIAEAFRERRDELEHSANDIVGELRRLSIVEPATRGLSTDLLDKAFSSFLRTFDPVNGGFGGAPKFPPSMSLEFLLRYHKRTGEDKALAIVEHTLKKMANGGIYDQLGGGFHRYAVDSIWLVPHFEKMLYDNAQLIRVYLHAFQVTGEDFYKRVAIETLEYVKREMLDDSGGFYSTQDADSEGEEGKFFVWTPEEIESILGVELAAQFMAFYDVTPGGNFEGHNILNIKEPGDSEQFTEARKRLFAEREKRIKPHRDEKILTAWNGLMLAAFADVAAVLGNEEYLNIAIRNADFLMSQMQNEGRLLRTWKNGTAKLNGYLEDYANVTDGMLALFQTSGNSQYLIEAKRLADMMITEFWDEEGGGFFFTSNDHEELIVRNKDFYDNATPSGNSAAADVLLRLSKLTGDERYERFGVAVLRVAASQLQRHPQGFGRALSALEFYLSKTKEIVIVGNRTDELTREVFATYLPDAVVVLAGDENQESSLDHLLTGRSKVDGMATVYVCENFLCQRPVISIEELKKTSI